VNIENSLVFLLILIPRPVNPLLHGFDLKRNKSNVLERPVEIEGGEADAASEKEESHENAMTFASMEMDRRKGDTPNRSRVGRG